MIRKPPRSTQGRSSAASDVYKRQITIGEAGSRGLKTYVQLFAAIALANDVRCDVASNSTYVYAYGFAEDIDATHALYASLVVQMVKACDCLLYTSPSPRDRTRARMQASA